MIDHSTKHRRHGAKDTRLADRRSGDGAVLAQGLSFDLDRRHFEPQPGQQRQPLLFLSGQAGRADRGARSLSRRHQADAARAGLERRRRPDRTGLRAARPLSPSIVDTDCEYGCPIGSLALELHEPDPAVRELLAANFDGWVDAVEKLLRRGGATASRRAPTSRALAELALNVMEGGVMQARTYRDVAPFDRARRPVARLFRCTDRSRESGMIGSLALLLAVAAPAPANAVSTASPVEVRRPASRSTKSWFPHRRPMSGQRSRPAPAGAAGQRRKPGHSPAIRT